MSVSLAHSGCDHTGFVVWEERADARGASGPSVVGLPRGFVSLNSEDGAIEVGGLTAEQLTIKNPKSETLAAAVARVGGDPAKLPMAPRRAGEAARLE